MLLFNFYTKELQRENSILIFHSTPLSLKLKFEHEIEIELMNGDD